LKVKSYVKDKTVSEFKIHPKHTTHSGGKGEFLHDWYPYLEGYSSEFVRSVYKNYMPGSKNILEPFAGVGTTPLTLSLDGIDSVYCEVNPAMRRVIDVKLAVSSIVIKEREFLYNEIVKLSEDIPALLHDSIKDSGLQETYKAAFKDSVFFSASVYDQVLQFRSLNDLILSRSSLLGLLLQVAVASQLLKCSKLKRAGDIRYKTEKELKKGIPDLVESVQKQLVLMANDCKNLPYASGVSKLIDNNAKNLMNIPKSGADGLITSPPYLNGTNYFRNTKLELWYMRDLADSKSLRKFRDEVVTSGINDVTKDKGNSTHAHIKDIVKSLYDNAYDKRIPKMVSGYFEEMAYVLKGAAYHLKPGSVACIDIGDSVYAGIHVPTHEILSVIANDFSFNTLDIVKLRDRRSKDKSLLSQSLIVLERK